MGKTPNCSPESKMMIDDTNNVDDKILTQKKERG